MICTQCGSQKLRCSRLRPGDLDRLLILHFPVRCRLCGNRDFVAPLAAWAIWRADRGRRRQRNQRPVS